MQTIYILLSQQCIEPESKTGCSVCEGDTEYHLMKSTIAMKGGFDHL